MVKDENGIHIIVRPDHKKTCARCGLDKHYSDFSIRKPRYSKFHQGYVRYVYSYCKVCENFRIANYYLKMKRVNIDEYREKQRRWRRRTRAKTSYKPITPNSHNETKINSEIVQREISILIDGEWTIETIAESMRIDARRIRDIMSYESKKKITLDWLDRLMIAVGKTLHDVPEYWEL